MKIAVVYSGEPRTFETVSKQHRDEFLQGLDYDSYHSTWIKTTPEECAVIENSANFKKIAKVDYNCVARTDLWHFESTLLSNRKNHPIFMLGRIQHMTAAAFDLVVKSKIDYDIVVRLRYDFKYKGKLIDYLPLVQKSNDVVITRKMGGKSSPVNVWDGFAFGTFTAMCWYFHFNKWIPFSLFNKDVASWKYQPEFVYGTYLRHVGLDVIDSEVIPQHVYPEGHYVDWHREKRTVQYYRDLANFHPEMYTQKNGKLTIENDSQWITDEHIINVLQANEGLVCREE
jgi:hypothetical protein|tara:strand:+ start:1400 stop:2254 length:855 start_codon:yes stop_codon:yes gene_type:complete